MPVRFRPMLPSSSATPINRLRKSVLMPVVLFFSRIRDGLGYSFFMQAKKAPTPFDAMTETRGTVRFQKIVETAGKPSVHLLWMDPAKDLVLQKAVKANCV